MGVAKVLMSNFDRISSEPFFQELYHIQAIGSLHCHRLENKSVDLGIKFRVEKVAQLHGKSANV
jgi:hypothetical protein